LDHDAGELDILTQVSLFKALIRETNFIFLQTVGEGLVNAFGAETNTELSNNEITTRL